MLGLTLDFMIGAVVTATFGFGGIIAASATEVRAIALVFFIAFLLLLIPALFRALRSRGPRRNRRARTDIPLIRARGVTHGNRHARIGA
jgi:uncharacterized membrane protein YtjA (UPF0391 family)